MTSSIAIDVHTIRKRFGAVEALRGVSFQIPAASVFCILGPNGAGKTTLFRILTTISRPDAGSATVLGSDIWRDRLRIRQQIGNVSQFNNFDHYLSIWHNLMSQAKMHGLSTVEANKRLQELLERVALYDRRSALPDELSGGMQRPHCLDSGVDSSATDFIFG